MTTFIDGPAKGKTLSLRNAPLYLRVTEENGKFDALDASDDTPRSGERIYAYRRRVYHGTAHIRMSGPGSGFYPICEYELCANQPTDGEARDKQNWIKWCEEKANA